MFNMLLQYIFNPEYSLVDVGISRVCVCVCVCVCVHILVYECMYVYG